MHDVSDGGLLVAIAEMAMPRGIGASIGLAGLPDAIPFWFGEDQARYVIAAPFAEAEKIVAEARAAFITVAELGKTGGDAITLDDKDSVTVAALKAGFEGWFPELYGGRRNPGHELKDDAMGMKGTEIETFIKDAFPDADIEMKDLAGDDNHWAATVTSIRLQGQDPRRAAPDGLCRAQGQYGRRAACPAADHRSPRTKRAARHGAVLTWRAICRQARMFKTFAAIARLMMLAPAGAQYLGNQSANPLCDAFRRQRRLCAGQRHQPVQPAFGQPLRPRRSWLAAADADKRLMPLDAL